MGALESKPEWVDTVDNGSIKCDSCNYQTNIQEHFEFHNKTYHEHSNMHDIYILYMACKGSIYGREKLIDRVSAEDIDCTGGQAAFEDGDLQQLGDQLVAASRETGVKIHHVYRMFDPGLGLIFPQWWVTGGLNAGVFQEYCLPDDVKALDNDDDNYDDSSLSDEDSDSISDTENQIVI